MTASSARGNPRVCRHSPSSTSSGASRSPSRPSPSSLRRTVWASGEPRPSFSRNRYCRDGSIFSSSVGVTRVVASTVTACAGAVSTAVSAWPSAGSASISCSASITDSRLSSSTTTGSPAGKASSTASIISAGECCGSWYIRCSRCASCAGSSRSRSATRVGYCTWWVPLRLRYTIPPTVILARSPSMSGIWPASRPLSSRHTSAVLPIPPRPVTVTSRIPGSVTYFTSRPVSTCRSWNQAGAVAGGGLTNFEARTGCGLAGTCSRTIPLPIRARVSASSRSERSTSNWSAFGLANDWVSSPLSWTRRRNASWRWPNSRSISRDSGIPTSAASVSSTNTSRSSPASVAVSNSSSVYDTSSLSGTGEPYPVPSTPTYTSHPRTRSAHTSAGA